MVDKMGGHEQLYHEQLEKLVFVKKPKNKLYQTIVDAPFSDPLMATKMGLGIFVFLLVDEDGKTINRVALSNTEHAANAIKTTEIPFNQIKIPLNDKKNIISKAIKTGKRQSTNDWEYLFTPALSAASARFNQATAGIVYSVVQPFNCKPYGGAFICSFYHETGDQSLIRRFINKQRLLIEAALKN